MIQKKNELIEIIVSQKKMSIEKDERIQIFKDSKLYNSLVKSAELLFKELYDEINEECRGKCIDEVKTTFYSVFSQSEKKIENIIFNTKMHQDTNVETKVETKVETEIKNVLKIDLPAIQTEFADLKDLMLESNPDPDPNLERKLKEIGDSLDEVTAETEKEKLNKPLNKVGRFLKELEDKNSKYHKIVSGTKKGIEVAQKLAKTYNKFAQWTPALPVVPDLFLGK
jgi:hypothetical protein